MYVESSAITTWLLAQSRGEFVRDLLERAESVFSSELTLVECERALIRAETSGAITSGTAVSQRAVLNREFELALA